MGKRHSPLVPKHPQLRTSFGTSQWSPRGPLPCQELTLWLLDHREVQGRGYLGQWLRPQ